MVEPNRFSGLADPKPRTPRGGPLLGLLGLIRFGLHGSGVPSRGSSLNIEREFQKREAQPAFLPGGHLGAPGDFVVGLHGSGVPSCVFSSNPREGVSKV